MQQGRPGAVKEDLGPTPEWHGKLRDAAGHWKRVKLCTGKTASQQMLAKLATDAKMATLGMVDAFEEHRKKALAEHLEDYRRGLEAKGNVAGHVQHTHSRVKAVLDGCRFVLVADLAPAACWNGLPNNGRPACPFPRATAT